MTTEEISVANIKCSGCVDTIKKELEKLQGMKEVTVFIEQDKVRVTYDDIDRITITSKLQSIGYPEATEKNGLFFKLKSNTGNSGKLSSKTIQGNEQ